MKQELWETRNKEQEDKREVRRGRALREGLKTRGNKKQQKGGEDGMSKGGGYYTHVILPGGRPEMETEFTYS